MVLREHGIILSYSVPLCGAGFWRETIPGSGDIYRIIRASHLVLGVGVGCGFYYNWMDYMH